MLCTVNRRVLDLERTFISRHGVVEFVPSVQWRGKTAAEPEAEASASPGPATEPSILGERERGLSWPAWLTLASYLVAVVAVTPRRSALAAYLTSLFGQPAATSGTVLAWRV